MAKTKQSIIKEVNKSLETSDFLNGGQLNPKQQKKYQQYIRNTNEFMQHVDLRFVDQEHGKIDKLYMTDNVLRGATEGTSFTDTTKPSFGKDEYSLKKLVGGFDVTFEFMRENVEKSSFKSTLINLFLERAATNISDLVVNGDSSLSSSTYPLLSVLDGFKKQSLSGNILDVEGAEISNAMFYAGYRAMPAQHRRNKNALRWFSNSITHMDWEETLSTREDARGQRAYDGSVIAPGRIPMLACDEIPTNLNVSYASATIPTVTGTVTDPFTISAANNAFTVNVNGIGAEALTVDAGVYTAQRLAAALNAELASGTPHVFTTDGWGRLKLRTFTAGSGSSIVISAPSNNMLTTVGISAGTTTGDGAGTNAVNEGTYMWLTDPKNFRVYVQDGFRTYWEFKPREDLWQFTIYQFVEPLLMNETAIVTVDNVKIKELI